MAGIAGSQPQDLVPTMTQAPVPTVTPAPKVTPAPQQGPTPEEIDAALSSSGTQASAPSPEEIDAVLKGTDESHGFLHTAGRVLDYAGGLMRTGLAGTASIPGKLGVPGAPDITTPEDIEAAFKGQAPSSATYLERAGMTPGWTGYIPGVGKVSARDVEGMALDIATDPITALGKLAKEVPAIQKFFSAQPVADKLAAVVANPAGVTASFAGRNMYRNTFGKLAAKVGPEVSDEVATQLLNKGGVPVTAKGISEATDQLSREMADIRNGFYTHADQAGATVDLANVKLPRSEQLLGQWVKSGDPAFQTAAEQLGAMIDKYRARGSASIGDVSGFKTSLYNAMPDSAFDTLPTGAKKAKAYAVAIKSALADDLKNAIVDAGNKAEKGLGTSIDALNERWGPLIEAKNPLYKQALQAENGGSSIGHQVDAILIASHAAPVAIVRNAMAMVQAAPARRAMAKALISAGESGMADAMSRRAIDSYRGQYTPAKAPNEEQP